MPRFGQAELVTRVVVETAYGPKIVIDNTEPPSGWTEALKPKASVYVRGFSNPIVIQPYGPPGETKWPLIRNALLASGALFTFFLVRGVIR